MKENKTTETIDLNKWVGLICTIGLFVNLFNDDPVASVLAWGFLGVISVLHMLVAKTK
jgi:hypothetical protein